jgi:23S rRNA (uracil1939-C5)-methyltransferase
MHTPDRTAELAHPSPTPPTLSEKVAWIGRMFGRAPDLVHPSPRQTAYRARIRLRPGPDGHLAYTRPGTHEPMAPTENAFARPELDAVLARLPPLPGLAEVELRSDGERVVLCACAQAQHGTGRHTNNVGVSIKDLARLLGEAFDSANLSSVLAGIALEGRAVRGDPVLWPVVGGLRLRQGPNSFSQVNLEINEALVARIGVHLRDLGAERLLDLYSGIGNLSLPWILGSEAISRLGATLIESNANAVSDARNVLAEAKVPTARVEVRQADAHRFQAGDSFFDVALLDPPRMGAPGVLPQLCMTRPKALLYVSCNPAALRRELGQLPRPYALTHLELFDMFPGTEHAEVLALLRPA